jgi:hypothetical protein
MLEPGLVPGRARAGGAALVRRRAVLSFLVGPFAFQAAITAVVPFAVGWIAHTAAGRSGSRTC